MFQAILDSFSNIVVKYVYDAWGNCKAYDKDGNEPSGGVGYFNPFRYRGYYWDRELGLYYLQTRYYDPELGRFISADDVNYLDPASITGLNLYAYCGNNPVMFYDPSGCFVISSLLISLCIAAGIGAAVGVAGTLISDLITSAICGEWKFSSWETYLGNAIGGAVGGAVSLFSPFAGVVIAGTLGTFSGLAIGKATGSNNISWQDIGILTAVSFGISLLTAGFTSYLKIPGITKGSHSWQQVFKAGLTKTLHYGFNMSAKTLLKGSGYLLVSSFSTGFMLNNLLQVILNFLILP